MKSASLNQNDYCRDRFFLFAAILGCVLWIASVSPLRIYATKISLDISLIVSIAPNFFAGLTFAFWQSYIVKSKTFVSVMYAASLVTAAEAMQLFIPLYVFDACDLAAGIIGVLIAMPLLLWREFRRL